jgi:hypothetical protein
MVDFDYKKYSLENLENWIHDAMSSSEASPQEIYDTIHKVVEENYYTYKKQASEAYELLALLNGNGKGHIEAYDAVMREKEYYEPSMPPWGHSDLEYMIHNKHNKESLSCDKNSSSPECKGAWNSFWNEEEYGLQYTDEEITAMCDAAEKKDKVVKWQLPIEIDASGEYFVSFPDDLLEAANLKEGDKIEWVDNNDGTYTLKKVN